MLSSLLVLLVLCIQGASGRTLGDEDYCNQPKEVIFLLDASVSVPDNEFQKLLNFTQTVIDNLDLQANSTRVSVILFGVAAEIKVAFDGYVSKEDLKEQVGNIRHQHGTSTNTHLGLQKAREQVFSSDDGITQIIICVTDGEPTNKYKVEEEVTALKERNVHIIAIGVGDEIFEEGLKALASEDSDEYVRSVDSFDTLNSLVDGLSWQLCAANGEAPANVDALGCANNMTELVIILDSSNSIVEPDFNVTRTFSGELINALDMGPELTQVALIVYGTEVAVSTDLNSDKDQVLLSLTNVAFQHLGDTHTETALTEAREKLQNGRESASRHIVVFFNDGFYQHKIHTEAAAEALRNDNTYIFGVGLGNNVRDKVKVITSDGHTDTEHQFYYHISETNAASSIAAEIGHLPCSAVAS